MTWDGVGYPGRGEGRKSPESPTSRVIAEIGKPTPGLNPLSPYFSGLNWGGGYHWNRIIGEIGNRDPPAECGCATRGIANTTSSQTQRARKHNELAVLAVRLFD